MINNFINKIMINKMKQNYCNNEFQLQIQHTIFIIYFSLFYHHIITYLYIIHNTPSYIFYISLNSSYKLFPSIFYSPSHILQIIIYLSNNLTPFIISPPRHHRTSLTFSVIKILLLPLLFQSEQTNQQQEKITTLQ